MIKDMIWYQKDRKKDRQTDRQRTRLTKRQTDREYTGIKGIEERSFSQTEREMRVGAVKDNNLGHVHYGRKWRKTRTK